MCLPKSTLTRRITTPPPFTPTSALMTKSSVSKLHVSPASKPPASRVKPDHPVSAVSALTVRNVMVVQNVIAAAARRVAASAMTNVRRVARVRTSPSA